MNKAIKIEYGYITQVPEEYQEGEGCVAFQKVEMTYTFYGKEMSEVFDTKILANGEQYVIDGNGFIKGGTKIK